MEQTQIIDTVSTTAFSTTPTTHDFWFWLAIAEFIILLTLGISKIQKSKKKYENIELKKKIKKEGRVDFSNTLMSAFHSHELYDKLKVKCHPDRFPQDSEENKIATEIFQELVANKNNYQKLLDIKADAEKKLNILI